MRRLALLAVAMGTLLLAGCNEYFSKGSYFDGAIIVEYKQSRSRGTDDYLTFRFYEAGTYQVSFSITPGKGGRGQSEIPKDFARTVEVAPREVLIKQFVLPDFLRVTITRDGKTEFQDFS